MEKRELFRRIQRGNYANVRFRDFVSLVEQFGFRSQRISGSHHIFWHPRSRVRLNIQSMGGDAKPYQIKQFLQLVERYALRWEDYDP